MKTQSDLYVDKLDYEQKLQDINTKIQSLLSNPTSIESLDTLVAQLFKEKYAIEKTLDYINSLIS